MEDRTEYLNLIARALESQADRVRRGDFLNRNLECLVEELRPLNLEAALEGSEELITGPVRGGIIRIELPEDVFGGE